MNIDEIHKVWEADAKIDENELGNEAIKIPQLHSKYWKLLTRENLRLAKLKSDFDYLKLEKTNFFIDGPTEEQMKLGWKLPPKGRILRADVQLYLNADQDLIALSLNIAIQNEKITLLESIIDNLNRRSFFIKNKIDFERFRNGEI
jgi:Recombination, repair and ssDNA binding protein UvsY